MSQEYKRLYKTLCETELSIPIFSRDWWLDAVCGAENWDVVLVEKGGRVIASMPYYKKKRMGFSILAQPLLTQTLGPWIHPSTGKYAKKIGYQKNVMGELISKLPKFDFFNQKWHYSYTNWLPFYWGGFKQTTYYTYVIPNLEDNDQIWEGMEANKRWEIRKASDRFGLRVRDDLELDAFLRLNKMTFERQGKSPPYADTLVKKIDDACKTRNCRKIWIVEDEQGRHHAGVYIVWDENSAYYLLGGGDPQLVNSGATSLVLWEAIKSSASVTKKFDFEGSMMEPIERFVRGFGAIQESGHRVTKINSKLIMIQQCLSEIRTSMFRNY
jgi:hypothetical protein